MTMGTTFLALPAAVGVCLARRDRWRRVYARVAGIGNEVDADFLAGGGDVVPVAPT